MPRCLIPLREDDPKNKYPDESRIIDAGRKRTNMNLPAVASAIGVSSDVMYAVRRGARRIEPPFRAKLEKLLDIKLPAWTTKTLLHAVYGHSVRLPKSKLEATVMVHGQYTLQRDADGTLMITLRLPSDAALTRMLSVVNPTG
jgi:hypothetical protein